ncbi:MAG: hypothetical protein Q7R32_04245 [Dehalococcoidia bacterium]|nr:hypothetical protein [Dehalococcoidia bacterium]
MRPYVAILVGLALGSVLLGACGGGGGKKTPAPAASPTEEGTPATGLNPADFQASVDNPFFPLSSLGLTVFEGQEPTDAGEVVQVRLETTVLPDTDVVAGIEVTVVEDKAFEDGELVESTLDYYAQHRDGSVYYFGERVDEYEGGKVVGHAGQWLTGEGDNQPGVYMPAKLVLDQTFEQEKAPGVAEDQSKVVALDQAVTTPAGSFSGCIKTEDFSPLDNATEFKFYCPDIGLVREEPPGGHLDLISY